MGTRRLTRAAVRLGSSLSAFYLVVCSSSHIMFGLRWCSTARPKASTHIGTLLRSLTGTSHRAAAAGTIKSTPAALGQERSFLIANSQNVVWRKECGSHEALEEGLIANAGFPNICIAGESNAGKSSVINHLLQKENIARASSVAGKTRAIDLMKVNRRLVIADLPGLPSRDGQVTDLWKKTWEPLVFDYIDNCDSLLAMVLVHDIRWHASPWVQHFLKEVSGRGLPVLLVLTKDDKIPEMLKDATDRELEHTTRQRLMKRVRKQLDFDGVHIHYSNNSELPSSRKARRQLLRYIESIVSAGTREESRALLESAAGKWADDVNDKAGE